MSEFDNTSQPIECYTFVLWGVGTYRYTSDNSTVTAEGFQFAPMSGLSSSVLPVPTSTENADMSVSMPATEFVVRECGLLKTPTRVEIELRRYQRDNLSTPTIVYKAVMKSASIKGMVCTMSCPSAMVSNFEVQLPKELIQEPCNWTLFDSRCKLAKAAFKLNGTGADLWQNAYTGIVENRYRLNVHYAGTPFNLGTLTGGTVSLKIGSTWYTRTIAGAFFFGADDVVDLTLNSPFPEYDATAVLEVYPGCDNSIETCRKYSNQTNFGGFPYVPTEKRNPFRLDLRYIEKK